MNKVPNGVKIPTSLEEVREAVGDEVYLASITLANFFAPWDDPDDYNLIHTIALVYIAGMNAGIERALKGFRAAGAKE